MNLENILILSILALVLMLGVVILFLFAQLSRFTDLRVNYEADRRELKIIRTIHEEERNMWIEQNKWLEGKLESSRLHP